MRTKFVLKFLLYFINAIIVIVFVQAPLILHRSEIHRTWKKPRRVSHFESPISVHTLSYPNLIRVQKNSCQQNITISAYIRHHANHNLNNLYRHPSTRNTNRTKPKVPKTCIHSSIPFSSHFTSAHNPHNIIMIISSKISVQSYLITLSIQWELLEPDWKTKK